MIMVCNITVFQVVRTCTTVLLQPDIIIINDDELLDVITDIGIHIENILLYA